RVDVTGRGGVGQRAVGVAAVLLRVAHRAVPAEPVERVAVELVARLPLTVVLPVRGDPEVVDEGVAVPGPGVTGGDKTEGGTGNDGGGTADRGVLLAVQRVGRTQVLTVAGQAQVHGRH